MRQSRGRGSKVETEARPCEAEARPSQLKNCLETASSRGGCLEDYIPVPRWRRTSPVCLPARDNSCWPGNGLGGVIRAYIDVQVRHAPVANRSYRFVKPCCCLRCDVDVTSTRRRISLVICRLATLFNIFIHRCASINDQFP